MIDELFDRVFVISMPSSVARRAYIREHFAATHISNYECFDAVVGADLDLDALKKAGLVAERPREHGGQDLLPGEIGASMSHIRVYETALARGYDRIMVCEDDIRFVRGANALFDYYMREVPADWDIVHFQSLRPVGSGLHWDSMRRKISEHVYLGYNEGAGASCYALTRRCTEFLLRHAYPINKAPDGLTNWPTGWWPECSGYRGYIVDPLPCVSGVFESDVGPREVDVTEKLFRSWQAGDR